MPLVNKRFLCLKTAPEESGSSSLRRVLLPLFLDRCHSISILNVIHSEENCGLIERKLLFHGGKRCQIDWEMMDDCLPVVQLKTS